MPGWIALLPTDLDAVGPYRLEGRLGTGGQGTVYVGSAVPGRQVAIKLLHPHLITDKRAWARFLREVEIAKRVAPFCTAQVLDSGVVNEQPYIVSEFVDGPSLQESVRGTGPRSGAALERLALNTATALAAIHQANVVHRDLKPGNVLLGPDGPVVIDFGIAWALDLSRSIVTSGPVGSPGYMAPEQIAGEEVGSAADLFAWGATMVFAATAKRAFGGDSIPAVMRSILHDEPDLDGLDGQLGSIVRACMAKDPARRPTAAEVGDRLRALPGPAWRTGSPAVTVPDDEADPGGEAAQDDGVARAPADDAKRRSPVLAGAAVLALLALLGIAYLVVPSVRGGGDTPQASSSGPGALPSPGPADSMAGRTGSPSTQPSAVSTTGAGRQNPRHTRDTPNSNGTKSPPPAPTKPSSRPSVGSGPKVLGTVSASDVNAYCKAHGYASGGQYGPGNNWCNEYGPAKQVNMTDVCRWRYPSYPNVKADGNTCKSS